MRVRIILPGREGELAEELESNEAATSTAQVNTDSAHIYDMGEMSFLRAR